MAAKRSQSVAATSTGDRDQQRRQGKQPTLGRAAYRRKQEDRWARMAGPVTVTRIHAPQVLDEG